MEYSALEKDNIALKHINRVDLIFKSLYERKITTDKAFSEISNIIDIPFFQGNNMKQEDVIISIYRYIKNEMKKMNKKIKGKPGIKSVIYDYNLMIHQAKSSNKSSKYIQFIELIGNLIFNENKINFDFENGPKTEAERIGSFLIYEAIKLIEKKVINEEAITDFLKLNHLLFLTNDDLQYKCLQFFLIIALLLSEKYAKFLDYYEFLLYFYYSYYKFLKKENLTIFKEEILSQLDIVNYLEFSFDKNVLNMQICSLSIKLENEIYKNKKFVLKCDKSLLNEPSLLKICHINKIDSEKMEKFFRFSIIQNNYLKYSLDKEREFDICVDQIIYDCNKLHLFNIFFIISCGLIDHIDQESLQIFNEDNNVIKLFKKYANILLNTINRTIEKKKNNNIINNEDSHEIFGFGKIYDTFYVLYTNLDDDKYKNEKLRFELEDNLVQKNVEKKEIIKINIKMNKSDCNSNFSISSQDSNKIVKTPEQSFYEKVNSDSLEEGCKNYILSKIENLILEKKDKIQIIELYKILFALNFYIPYVDKNYNLKFIPVTKKILGESKEYGYNEFDYLFKVCSTHDIPLNEKNDKKTGLPFVKSHQITIECINKFDYKINCENKEEFALKKNSLVIIENKTRFPKNKDKLKNYVFILLKKLNFIIKLIKHTTKDFKNYENFQLLLIYDDILINSEEIKNFLLPNEINLLLANIPFTERVKFTLEIIYVSQVVHYFNITRAFEKMNEIQKQLDEEKQKTDELARQLKILNEKLSQKGMI